MTTAESELGAHDLECLVRTIKLVAFDFDGVFTDNMVYVLQDGAEAVRCFRGDGLGLARLRRAGIATIVISTETNPVVSARSSKLGIRCIQSCGDKREALESVMREMRISPAQTAFVGNDVNDATCLSIVGLPIVVGDAHPDVLSVAKYRTQASGGKGAVREICDMFAHVLEGDQVITHP